MVTKDSQLSKAERRDAARAQALKLQQEQVRREKRTRAIIIGSLVAGLAIVGVIVYAILRSAPEDLEGISTIPASVETPSVANDAGGISFGETGEAGTTSGDDAVTVDVYLDYMCPNCGQFEVFNGPDLDDLRTSGDITLVLHPVSILDGASLGTSYSTRASAAFAYVAENAPESALAFNVALFANQPTENTEGLTDEQIEGIAVDAGVSADVAAGIADQTYMEFVAALTQVAYGDPSVTNSEGGFGTPTVVINGERFEGNWAEDGALSSAIADAQGTATVEP
ncbi:DsbA family protein [Sanguibacter antarcticus]|uniref:Protein-disulfide isomerase n=1 Tax=Sanguibacter antarcticus TaxID=372484 RepID=A0A2A9E9D2_9MICO|nr:thioredoxin domain-containing protein [Sanguibacter antarcticus]PFG35286.1 protein-disulfide isomerase [Sanguibacter antarcticus]